MVVKTKRPLTAAQRRQQILQKKNLKAETLAALRARLSITLAPLTSMEDPRKRSEDIRNFQENKRHQNRRIAKGKEDLAAGNKLDSSFVNYLEFIEGTDGMGIVNFTLGDRKYHIMNFRATAFVSWWQGAATCQTSDKGKRKRWKIDDTPSLGAFFNHYVKYKKEYKVEKGWAQP